MKKYIGAFASALAGILTFVFLSLDGLVSKTTAGSLSTSNGISGWDILSTEGSSPEGIVLYKIAVIAMIVLASLLIISAVVIILKNAKVFKSKAKFNVINNILLALFALSTILAFVGACVMGGNISVGSVVKGMAGIGSWLNMVAGVVACAMGWLFARDK